MRPAKYCVWGLIILGLVCGIAFGFNPDRDSSLVGCWKLDETSGTVAYDSSTYGNNGVVMGNPKWAPGKMKGCLDMDGNGDYVDCGNPSLFNFGDVITVAVWLNIRTVQGQWMAAVAKGESAWRISLYDTNQRIHFSVRGSPNYEAVNGNIVLGLNEWHHVAGVYDGTAMKLYIDGVLDNTTALTGGMHTAGGNLLIGDNPQATGRYWNGMLDDVRIYHKALSEDEIKVIVKGIWDPVADNPIPKDGKDDVPRDAVLAWTAGPYAKTHDVYFGTSFEDVNQASRQDPRGVLLSKDQQGTTFDPPGLLEYGQKYYWRVDEVNGAPDYTIYKGLVWSFTAEPFSYRVKPIKATASSVYKATASLNTGPEKTIDGSGLVGDAHSTNTADMWISKLNVSPIWIQYEFDKVYKLDQVWVWNSNQNTEPLIGYGAKDVEILYSEDGQTWNSLGTFEFAQGPGEPDYVTDIKVSLGGVFAKYVKFDIKSSWGGKVIASISEVRFYTVPLAAFGPEPADGAADVAIDATLNWRPGRQAAGHKLYLGTDKDAVSAGTVQPMTLQDHKVSLGAFTPMYATTYYWRVDEVNDQATPALVPGDVWSFKTIGYAVVDDFESYDDTCNRIYVSWIDQLGHSGLPDCGIPAASGNNTGGIVGNSSAPFAGTVAYAGRQSMPFAYDNSRAPYYSETTRTWKPSTSWTGGGLDTLTLYVRGDAVGFVEVSPGVILMNGQGTDIWDTSDQFRFVYKRLSGNGSIVARVDYVVDSHEWAKAGVMIRESLESGSRHAMVVVTPRQGVSFQRRLETSGTSSNTDLKGVAAPYWVRLTRNGNTFIGECSADGVNWTPVGADASQSQATIQMGTDVYIGLAVCSHVATVPSAARFSGIATTGGVSGAWVSVDIGATQPLGNTPDHLYVEVADSTGGKKLVVNPDPLVIASGRWERWDIPLASLSGVNLGSIRSLTIGIGDRAAPKPAGTGKVYIDEIRLTRQ